MAKRHVTGEKRDTVWEKSGGICHWCGNPMVRREGKGCDQLPDDFTIEHLVPVAAGGSNAIKNLVGAHQECNRERGKVQVQLTSPVHYTKVSPAEVQRWKLDDPKTTQYCRSLRDGSIQAAISRGIVAQQKPLTQLVRYKPFAHKPVGWLTRVARWVGAV